MSVRSEGSSCKRPMKIFEQSFFFRKGCFPVTICGNEFRIVNLQSLLKSQQIIFRFSPIKSNTIFILINR